MKVREIDEERKREKERKRVLLGRTEGRREVGGGKVDRKR